MSVNARVHSLWYSSCSWRVRIALKLKCIPHTIIPVADIGTNKFSQHISQYNPMEYVPALEIDNMTFVESIAIMEYLEETRPDHPLLPKDPIQKCLVRQIVQMIACGIQPLQNTGPMNFVGERKREFAAHWIQKGLRAIEKLLATIAGKYCVGDQLTMADVCLVPQVFNARRYPEFIDMTEFPIICRIEGGLLNHSAFHESHPLIQGDCPTLLPSDVVHIKREFEAQNNKKLTN